MLRSCIRTYPRAWVTKNPSQQTPTGKRHIVFSLITNPAMMKSYMSC